MACRLCLLVSLCLAVVGVARTAEPPAAKKDPQGVYEPRSAPGAGQKFLEGFVGTWDVVKTFYPREGAPVRLDGECRQTMLHGGRFLRSEFVFRRDGAETTGLGILGFEPATGKFTSVWTDSRQTRMSLRQSDGPFDGKEIVLHSRSLDRKGTERRSRTVTRLEDDGRKIVHQQFNAGPDGKERLLMELVLTRKATPPAR